jgi:hypothetical protein
MMTNEQRREVAEKVWGWRYRNTRPGNPDTEYLPMYWYQPKETDGQLVPTFNINQLKDEINSWEGFGRTVESMRGHPNSNMFEEMIDAEFHSYLLEIIGQSSFFEATHLAALEAKAK